MFEDLASVANWGDVKVSSQYESHGMDPFVDDEIEKFIADGFVRFDGAVTAQQAATAAAALFSIAEIDPMDPGTWSSPVLRIDGSTDPSVVETITTTRLTTAIDQLVGESRWASRDRGFGTFPIRFPSDVDPGDTGWHIDGSFDDPPHYKCQFGIT